MNEGMRQELGWAGSMDCAYRLILRDRAMVTRNDATIYLSMYNMDWVWQERTKWKDENYSSGSSINCRQ